MLICYLGVSVPGGFLLRRCWVACLYWVLGYYQSGKLNRYHDIDETFMQYAGSSAFTVRTLLALSLLFGPRPDTTIAAMPKGGGKQPKAPPQAKVKQQNSFEARCRVMIAKRRRERELQGVQQDAAALQQEQQGEPHAIV